MSTYDTPLQVIPWSEQLGHVESWIEWCVANRLNRAEWVLLQTPDWIKSGFVDSPLRQARLANMTALAHSYGLVVGVDIPIAEVQQHGWFIVDTKMTSEQQKAAIHTRVPRLCPSNPSSPVVVLWYPFNVCVSFTR